MGEVVRRSISTAPLVLCFYGSRDTVPQARGGQNRFHKRWGGGDGKFDTVPFNITLPTGIEIWKIRLNCCVGGFYRGNAGRRTE